MEAYLFVDGIQELYEEFVGQGLDIPYPPTSRMYNCTEIEVVDCDGHKLVFGEDS